MLVNPRIKLLFKSTSCKYKHVYMMDHGSKFMLYVLYHTTFWLHMSMFNTTRVKKWCSPHKTLARFLFSKNSYTRRRCVWCTQHPFNFTRFLCIMPLMDTISLKKSLMTWWDLVVNNFIANFVPSTKDPYNAQKRCTKSIVGKVKGKTWKQMINYILKNINNNMWY